MPALFDYLKSITNKKIYYSTEEDLKGYSQFMVNRFMMSLQSFVPIISELNTEYVLTDRMHYDLLFHAIPKTNSFLKYNMGKEAKEQVLQYVMTYFNIDLNRAKTYMILINKEELDYIVEFYENRGANKTIKPKGKKK